MSVPALAPLVTLLVLGELAAGTMAITFVADTANGSSMPGQEWSSMIPKRPLLTADHIETMFAAARHGLGIAGLPSFVVEDALRGRTLERVLPAWRLIALTFTFTRSAWIGTVAGLAVLLSLKDVRLLVVLPLLAAAFLAPCLRIAIVSEVLAPAVPVSVMLPTRRLAT